MNQPIATATRMPGQMRGVHHLALNTADMAATIDFYAGLLGFRLVHALRVPPGVGIGPANRGNPPFENLRHYFFDMGGDSLLAFFELPADQVGRADRNAIGGMQHVSFAVDAARAEVIQAALQARDIAILGPIDIGARTWSIYFIDPNNIRLEMSWQMQDDSEIDVVGHWAQSQREILAELRTLDAERDWSGVIGNLAG